jgi:hypothetical protein
MGDHGKNARFAARFLGGMNGRCAETILHAFAHKMNPPQLQVIASYPMVTVPITALLFDAVLWCNQASVEQLLK